MLNKKYIITRLFVVGVLTIGFLSVSKVNAEENFNSLPAVPTFGFVEDTNTHFEIKNSKYLNLIFDSSEKIKLRAESVPETITIRIEPVSSVNSTEIKIQGLNRSTGYYKYEDNYHNLATFTADENGVYTYTQNLSEPHLIFIQPRASTKFIIDDPMGGDCASIGIWDVNNKTCTLTSDLNETIEIDSDTVTLNGNSHSIIGNYSGSGVYVYGKTRVTVTNLNIQNFSYGVYLYNSDNNTLKDNIIFSSSLYGVFFDGLNNHNNVIGNTIKFGTLGSAIAVNGTFNSNLIEKNDLESNYVGIYFRYFTDTDGENNVFSDNSFIGNNIGLYFTGSGNTLKNNKINSNGSGIVHLTWNKPGFGNKIISNDISYNGNDGIEIFGYVTSTDHLIKDNSISNNGAAGIAIVSSYIANTVSNNIVTNNTFSNNDLYNGNSLYIYNSSDNKIYNNNIIGRKQQQVYVFPNNISNIFNLSYPVGGNYWSNFDTPEKGCSDSNNDNICDSAYNFGGGTDYFPWTKQNGWLIPRNQPPTFSNLNQYKLDGQTAIFEGETTSENTVVFKAGVYDIDGDNVKLQIEIRQFNESFNENDLSGIIESGFVNSSSTATVSKSNLSNGQYKWRARAIDDKGNVSGWQEFGTAGNVDFTVKSLVNDAIEKAKAVVGGNYTLGAKGFNWQLSEKKYLSAEQIGSKEYTYTYLTKDGISNNGRGVDCSGLSMWSYNSSYDLSKYMSIVKYENADGQYYNNVLPVEKGKEQPGDLMFFNWDGATHKDGPLKGLPVIEHVAIYTGTFIYNGDSYDLMEAKGKIDGIVPSKTANRINLSSFVGFGRVNDPRIGFSAKTASPIDLIVTDPNGITIGPDTIIETDEEYLREIPGELYYSIYDIEPDGTPQTQVYSPQLKQGNYIIKPVKQKNAPVGAVYSISVDSNVGPLVVADNISVDSIPQNGYGVLVQKNSITKVDINPPATTVSATGILGENGWYTSDVIVSLTATDTESGVASTNYSFDNGLTWFTYNTATPIVVNKEGTTTVVYYSADNAGNKEATSTITIKIDKTPPEAKIYFDKDNKTLKIEGIDNLTFSPQTTSTIQEIIFGDNEFKDIEADIKAQYDEYDGVEIQPFRSKDMDKRGIIYQVKDDAGHTLILTFKKLISKNHLIYVFLDSLQYDKNPIIKLSKTKLSYLWLLDKSNNYKHLSQRVRIQNLFNVSSHYNQKQNRTSIVIKEKGKKAQKQTLLGLAIIKLITGSGSLNYEY